MPAENVQAADAKAEGTKVDVKGGSEQTQPSGRKYCAPACAVIAILAAGGAVFMLHNVWVSHVAHVTSIEQKLGAYDQKLEKFERRIGRVQEKVATSNRSIRELIEVSHAVCERPLALKDACTRSLASFIAISTPSQSCRIHTFPTSASHTAAVTATGSDDGEAGSSS